MKSLLTVQTAEAKKFFRKHTTGGWRARQPEAKTFTYLSEVEDLDML